MSKTVKCLRCGNNVSYEEKDENFFGKCKSCGNVCALNQDYNDILLETKQREDTSKIFEYIMIATLSFSIIAFAFTALIGFVFFGLCIAMEVVWKRYKGMPPSTQKQYNNLRAKLRCNDAEGWYVLREEDRDVPQRDAILAGSQDAIIDGLLCILDTEFENMYLIGIDTLHEQCKTAILEATSAYEDGVRSGKPPRVIVLFLILNLASGLLESGVFHVYRGLLGMEGMDIQKAWEHCGQELMSKGFIAADELDEARDDLENSIAQVG